MVRPRVGPSWTLWQAARAQAEPNPGGLNATRWKLAFLLRWGFPQDHAGWACLGPNFRGRYPHTKPSCPHSAQFASKRAHVAPCWTPVEPTGRVRRKLGPSWPQVGSCSAQLEARTAKFDPSRLWAKYARSFPLYPILWMRAVLLAKRLEQARESYRMWHEDKRHRVHTRPWPPRWECDCIPAWSLSQIHLSSRPPRGPDWSSTNDQKISTCVSTSRLKLIQPPFFCKPTERVPST